MKNIKKRSINVVIEDCALIDIYYENLDMQHHAYLTDELCEAIEELYWDHVPATVCKRLQKLLQEYKAFQYLDVASVFQNCTVNLYINDTHYQYYFYKNKLF